MLPDFQRVSPNLFHGGVAADFAVFEDVKRRITKQEPINGPSDQIHGLRFSNFSFEPASASE